MKLRSGVLIILLAAGAPAAAMTPEELFEQRSKSVLLVHVYDKQGKKMAQGSAVVIGAEQAITNCHVLARGAEITVSRGNASFGATLEFPDPERDLCQLKVRDLPAPAVPLGSVGKVRVGQRVYAIGSPQGLELTLSDGLVSSLREMEEGKPPVIQTSTPVSPGSSGGGLFDANGLLVGITTFAFRGQQLNFAVPADWVREVPERGRLVLAKRKDEAQARASAAKQAPAGQPPIDSSLPKEMPQAGDTWTYAAVDVTYKPLDRSRKFVHTVRESSRRAIVEVVTSNGRQVGEAAFTPELLGIYRSGAEVIEVAPFATAFRKLVAGEQWGPLQIRGLEAIGSGAVSGETPYEFQGAKVVGQERLTTSAGTFDAVRVELEGRVSNVLLGNSNVMRGYSSFKQTVWYAPAVKRSVKALLETPSYAVAYELESYSLR
jgi:hypothetical protein